MSTDRVSRPTSQQEQDRSAGYDRVEGRWQRPQVTHRDAEYDSRGFELLDAMQKDHFWYQGRRRFLREAVERHLPLPRRTGVRALDLGGGAGGWVAFIQEQQLFPSSELALGDSSVEALHFAQRAQGERISYYQTDLMALGWQSRWDVVFLLDVLEHLPDDTQALRQVYAALAPGGTCIVTVPALQQFWSWNDEVVGHQRRYSSGELGALANDAGFDLLDARYFMFLLSPLLAVSRWLAAPKLSQMTAAERWALVDKGHQVPHPLLNRALAAVFGLETPLGHRLQFPWGTSALAVLRKPAT